MTWEEWRNRVRGSRCTTAHLKGLCRKVSMSSMLRSLTGRARCRSMMVLICLYPSTSNEDEPHHSIRRYIREGHEDHFEKSGWTPRPSTKPPLNSIRMWSATGPQHDPANHRNVILGKIDPSDNWQPPKVTLGPSLLAPAGNYHKDVIDNRFAEAEGTLEPEIPSYSSLLFRKPNECVPEVSRQSSGEKIVM